jgi:hypothetical protein
VVISAQRGRHATESRVLSLELPDATLPDPQLTPRVGEFNRQPPSCPSKLRELKRELIVLAPQITNQTLAQLLPHLSQACKRRRRRNLPHTHAVIVRPLRDRNNYPLGWS